MSRDFLFIPVLKELKKKITPVILFKLHPVNKRADNLGAVQAQYFSIPLKIFAGVCSLGNVCNMAPWHYEAEGMPPSCLPLVACITPCIRSWPPLHGFWPPSSQRAIASIQESFYPLRGRTRSVVNSKPWITSSKLIGGHLPKTMKLNISRREKNRRLARLVEVQKSRRIKPMNSSESTASLSHFNRSPSIYASFLSTSHVSARSIECLIKF